MTAQPEGLPDFMSPEQLADYIGMPLATVRKWHQRGKGPAAHRIGRHLRYSRADVAKWLAGTRETHQGPIALTPITHTARRAATRRAG
jgi:excisionase family DNA binding protein